MIWVRRRGVPCRESRCKRAFRQRIKEPLGHLKANWICIDAKRRKKPESTRVGNASRKPRSCSCYLPGLAALINPRVLWGKTRDSDMCLLGLQAIGSPPSRLPSFAMSHRFLFDFHNWPKFDRSTLCRERSGIACSTLSRGSDSRSRPTRFACASPGGTPEDIVSISSETTRETGNSFSADYR